DSSWLLWFLTILVWIVITHLFVSVKVKQKAFLFANFEALKKVVFEEVNEPKTNKVNLSLDLLFLRLLTLLFLILSLCHPVVWYEGDVANRNYVLAIDSSSSMLADDMNPNRFEVAKTHSKFLINRLKSTKSKVGIVSFAGSSIIVSELSDDYEKLKAKIDSLDILNIPGTDLGEAIITSANLLQTETKPGAVILITDGRSTVGTELEQAVYYAKELKIPIYTIGIGTKEGGKFIPDGFTKLDEDELKQIAEQTNGKFFRAETKDDLGESLKEIVETEKGLVPLDLTIPFMLIGLILLTVEWGLLNTKRRTLP
ncbi:MAG: Ca-activated chloride channel, partial [Candidatus Woesearchaeota archaeon]|nr:Ca-activated chloride channel [Candidatus Woesearchaeota archaeon]